MIAKSTPSQQDDDTEMRFLDRTQLAIPDDWQSQVEDKVPNFQTYTKTAHAFERLALNGQRRRTGFRTYAPDVPMPPLWGRDKRVKDNLDRWSHGKCAYCETPINARRSKQVEHFQPKSLFPSLAYDFENYFLACNGCNGAKSDHWPKRGAYVRPDHRQVQTRFNFDTKGRMTVQQGDNDAKRTVRDLELDRKELRKKRQVVIRMQTQMMQRVIEAPLSCDRKYRWARVLVRDVEAPDVPFSQALIQTLCQLWLDHCPDKPLV